jgi:hypothetical protein
MFFIYMLYNLPLFRFYVEIISYLHSSNENTFFILLTSTILLIAQGRTAINNSTYKSKVDQIKKILLHLLINTVLFLLIAIRLT